MAAPPTQPGEEPGLKRDAGLFRQEALRHYLEGGRQGEILRLTPSWTRWVYWLLLLTAAAGAAFVALARVDQYAVGPAIIETSPPGSPSPANGTDTVVIALLPGRYAPLLVPGLPLQVAFDSDPGSPLHLTIDAVEPRILGPAEARRRLGAGEGDPRVSGPVFVVRAALPARGPGAGARGRWAVPGMTGRAQTPVRSERLISALLPFTRPES